MHSSAIIIATTIILIFISPKSNSKKENNSILSFDTSTILRGIAILLVIFQHVGGSFGTNLLTPWGGDRSCYFPNSIRIWSK